MIEANGNCSNIHTVDKDSHERVLHNLAYIEKKYGSKRLYRCHKSFIVNPSHIEALILKDHKVILKNGLAVPLSEKSLKYIKQRSSGP